MRSIVVLLLFSIFSLVKANENENLDQLWNEHKEKYELEFSDNEDENRKSIFENHYYYIRKHNLGDSTYKLGLNKFSHMSYEEFKDLYLKPINIEHKNQNKKITKSRKSHNVSDIDWRKKNVVTEVQNQGTCGSCWAFSATGSLESQYAIKYKKLIKLSEQDLVDCSKSYGNQGCNGGLMDYAFQYVRDNGICNSSSYPYHAKEQKCAHTNKCSVLTIKSIKLNDDDKDEKNLQSWIKDIGPISVGMDASAPDFMHYKSGVYSSKECSSDDIDHAILAVGMGSKPSKHYILKNSWGKDWGMEGYFLLARDKNNMCGIATYTCYPVL